jgi:ATP phosphoribosyltransferase regulatory subunit
MQRAGGELASKMFSFVDPNGVRLSLRPEMTSSVARCVVAGSFGKIFPLRIQCSGQIFRYEGAKEGGMELQQLGAELFGIPNIWADAEIISLAVQGLMAIGIHGHTVRVGDMGVVNAILRGLNISERGRMILIDSLSGIRSGSESPSSIQQRLDHGVKDRKQERNSLAELARRLSDQDAVRMVEGFLANSLSRPAGQRTIGEIRERYLRKLRESDDPSVIKRAIEFMVQLAKIKGSFRTTMPKLRRLLSAFGLDVNLLSPIDMLLSALSSYDLGRTRLILDLGATRSPGYYTGPIFTLEHPRLGPVPSLGGGGRYDSLTKALGGSEMPALGFAYTVDAISLLLPSDFGTMDQELGMRVLVTSQESDISKAVETAERLRRQGIPAELDLLSRTDIEAAAYAAKKGIQTVMRVGRDGSTDERSI